MTSITEGAGIEKAALRHGTSSLIEVIANPPTFVHDWPVYLYHWLWNTTDGTGDASFGHMGSGATDVKQEKGDVLMLGLV